jgi:signal transduction histidine kinase
LDGKIAVQLMVPESAAAYDPRVTEHVYRIVQQAARNAVRYSQAKELCLEGVLEDGRIHLRVIDDGIGFTLAGQDLSALLRDRHYGLVNMKERAALVGAQLSIDSNPGHGTQVSLYWEGQLIQLLR